MINENGVFTQPQRELSKVSWDLLLRKTNSKGEEVIKKLTPSEKIIKDLEEMGVFDN